MPLRVESAVRRCRLFPAIPLLVVALLAACGTNPDERRLSIYKLKEEPSADSVERIRGMLADSDRDVRATALNALVGLGVEDSAAIALASLEDGDGFVRATAAKLLGDLGDSAFAGPLAERLTSDNDPSARQRAAESLERIGGDVALEALIQGLGDPMERVRMASVKGVSELGADRARPELARLLREDVVWEIRAEAAHALGLTGHSDALVELEAAQDDPNEFVRSAVANAVRIHGEVAGSRDP